MQGIRLGQGNAFLLKSGGKAVMKGEEEKEPQPSQISSRNVPVSTDYLKTHVFEFSILFGKLVCNPRGLNCTLRR